MQSINVQFQKRAWRSAENDREKYVQSFIEASTETTPPRSLSCTLPPLKMDHNRIPRLCSEKDNVNEVSAYETVEDSIAECVPQSVVKVRQQAQNLHDDRINNCYMKVTAVEVFSNLEAQTKMPKPGKVVN